MEKRRAHYDLEAIQNQMSCLDGINLTESARHSIKSAGMNMDHVLEVIKGLNTSSFYKSMTTYSDNRTWQDVYHAEWEGRSLYVKFQQACEYFIVSFKEL